MVTATDITARKSTPTAKPKPKVQKKKPINLGPNCRDLLDEIKTLSYLIEDEGTVIKDLHSNLEQVKKFLISVIREKDSIKHSGGLVQSDVDHQIVIAKNNEYYGTQDESIKNKHDIVNDGNENEVQLFIEHPSLSTQHIENEETGVMEVMTVNDTSSLDSHGPVITIDNHIAGNSNSENTAEAIAQHNLNPQEFQVLTNMIHVLLEENKANPQEQSS